MVIKTVVLSRAPWISLIIRLRVTASHHLSLRMRTLPTCNSNSTRSSSSKITTPTVPEVSQVNNNLSIIISSHQIRGEAAATISKSNRTRMTKRATTTATDKRKMMARKEKKKDSNSRNSMMNSKMRYLKTRSRHTCGHNMNSTAMNKRRKRAKKAKKATRKAVTTDTARKTTKRAVKSISESLHIQSLKHI